MLDTNRFKDLRDFEQIHFHELMESVPNSLGEISKGLNKSERDLKKPYSVSSQPHHNSPLEKQPVGYKTDPPYTNNHIESSSDRSSRQLFSATRSCDFSQISLEGDRLNELSLTNSK